MTTPPLDPQVELPGIIRRATLVPFEPGVWTVVLTPSDAEALGVRRDVQFTATSARTFVEAVYEDGLAVHCAWEPSEPERQALAYREALHAPAREALNLLFLALLRDERP